MEARTKKLIIKSTIGGALIAVGFLWPAIHLGYTNAIQGREMEATEFFFTLFCMFTALVAIVAMLVCLIWMAFEPRASHPYNTMKLAALTILFQIFVVRGAILVARKAGFHQAARDSAPLVAAIKQYETKHGKPPDRLEALFPEFRSALANKGFYGYQTFNYSPKEKLGNAWTMTACWGSDECFYYYPHQNYGEDEYFNDKQWHMVEDWAMIKF